MQNINIAKRECSCLELEVRMFFACGKKAITNLLSAKNLQADMSDNLSLVHVYISFHF